MRTHSKRWEKIYIEKMEVQLKDVISYVEEKTNYLIFIKGFRDGKLLTGTCRMDDEKVLNVAFVYGKSPGEVLHELGHLLATPGVRPISLISQLLRELTAWQCAENLHYRFGIPFNVRTFDEGLGSYIFELVASEECPSFGWLSQLLGE